jgi:hypothetical protein
MICAFLFAGSKAHMSPSSFELETDRLILRPHAVENFDESLALWSDEIVTRFIGGKPFSRRLAAKKCGRGFCVTSDIGSRWDTATG